MALGITDQSKTEDFKILRQAEADASRSAATESTLKANGSPTSWWPSLSLWSKESGDAGNSLTPTLKRSEQKPRGQD